MSLLRRMVDEKHSLKSMALLVRRAGLVHLVTDPTPEEIQALADAGDELVQERHACLVKMLRAPIDALRPFDGGAAARAETKARACALRRKVGP